MRKSVPRRARFDLSASVVGEEQRGTSAGEWEADPAWWEGAEANSKEDISAKSRRKRRWDGLEAKGTTMSPSWQPVKPPPERRRPTPPSSFRLSPAPPKRTNLPPFRGPAEDEGWSHLLTEDYLHSTESPNDEAAGLDMDEVKAHPLSVEHNAVVLTCAA